MSDKFVIIDGNSLINRAFYALPPLTTKDGLPVQGVYGFTTMLIKAIERFSPKYLAVAFDLPKPTFRHEKFSQYKAQRKGMPQELAVQLPILKEMLDKMGIAIIEREGYEADDVIGTMAKNAKCDTYIVTGDRDALQLIDSKIKVVLTQKGLSEILELDEAGLAQHFSLTPSQVIDYKALCGDSSDNIPGVAGVGAKTAQALLESYKTLDGVYENLQSIKGALKDKLTLGKDMAYLSYELATIKTDSPINMSETDCSFKFPFEAKVRLFFADKAFKTLIKRDELFEEGGAVEEALSTVNKKPQCIFKVIKSIDELKEILSGDYDKLAFSIGSSINIATGFSSENAIVLTQTLFDEGLDYIQVLETLKEVLKDPSKQKLVFDYKTLKKQAGMKNIEISNFIDVKLLQYICDSTAEYETIEQLLNYYSIDEREPATGLLFVASMLLKQLENQGMHKLYYDVELPLCEVLLKLERRGFCVDIARLNELGDEYTQKQSVLSEEIFALSNQVFNINSPKQLGKVLFEDMGIPYPSKGKAISTSQEILSQIQDKHPIAQKVLDFRFYSKLISTYVDGLKKVADYDGIIHTEFKQALTTTGRLSSTEPNLQNIPVRQDEGRRLRHAFVAKGDNVLITADYSQIELRLMAHFSRDEKMIAAYRNGEDIHTSTAAEVFGVDRASVTSAMRRDAKAVNFGIIYGISEFGLGLNLGIAPYKAREYIARYFERFKGVKEYLDMSVKLAKERGYASTLLNRIRKIPQLYSSNYNMRQFGERVAMNMPLQGSAADIIKIAMLNVERALEGMNSKLILQIHDELIVDTHQSEIEQVKQILKKEMENAYELAVPLTVDIGVGKSWFDCK